MSAPDLITERETALDKARISKIAGSDQFASPIEQSKVGTINRGEMSVACVITTQNEDCSLDIIMTDGIDLTYHELNPVVNYNHGISFDKPIGKAKTPDGIYTVTRSDGMLKATTYFSQNLLEAEQFFQLIEEGILNGVSIGAIPIDIQKRNVVNWKGQPGLNVYKCRLFEYSHTSNPDNQQALTERVLGGRLAGKSISSALYKSLAPQLKPQPEQVVSGFSLSITDPVLAERFLKFQKGPEDKTPTDRAPAAGAVAPSSADNPSGGSTATTGETGPANVSGKPPAKTEIKSDQPGKTDDTADPQKDWPPGAKAMHGIHCRIMETAQFIESSMKGQEPGSKASEYLAEKAQRYAEDADELKSMWKENYKDFDLGEEEKGESEAGESSNKSLGKYLAAFRQSILKSAQTPDVKLQEENAKLRKALEESLDREERLRVQFNKARRGR